jgi:hypothetical protein
MRPIMKKKNYGSWDMAGFRSRSYVTPKARVVPKPVGTDNRFILAMMRETGPACSDCGYERCCCHERSMATEAYRLAQSEGFFLELHDAAPVCEDCGQSACECKVAEGYARVPEVNGPLARAQAFASAQGAAELAKWGAPRQQPLTANAALNEHIRAHQEAYGRWSDPRLSDVAPVPPSAGPVGPQYISISPVAEQWVRQPNGSIIKTIENGEPMREHKHGTWGAYGCSQCCAELWPQTSASHRDSDG